MKDSALVEHLHARGYRIEITDVPMIREACAVLCAQPDGADCDQAFEEQYKCSARDPSNAGDLAKFRDGWAARPPAAKEEASSFVRDLQAQCKAMGWVTGAELKELLKKHSIGGQS